MIWKSVTFFIKLVEKWIDFCFQFDLKATFPFEKCVSCHFIRFNSKRIHRVKWKCFRKMQTSEVNLLSKFACINLFADHLVDHRSFQRCWSFWIFPFVSSTSDELTPSIWFVQQNVDKLIHLKRVFWVCHSKITFNFIFLNLTCLSLVWVKYFGHDYFPQFE